MKIADVFDRLQGRPPVSRICQDLPFLAGSDAAGITAAPVPQVIWAFWTGDNPLTENRAAGLERMTRNMGVPVTLVTPATLDQYILPHAPLHPAYSSLSLVHRADYLRGYFMHHYGGGYADIKPHDNDWRPAFRRLTDTPSAIAIGYPEKRPEDLGFVTDFYPRPQVRQLNKAMRRRYKSMIGNCAYIFRPGTAFTLRWMDEVHQRLDLVLPELQAHPGNILGDNPGYPLPWTSILGQIFHPLCLKFQSALLIDPALRQSGGAYR